MLQAPMEAAKGAVEKVVMVRLPILMRILLPGGLATAVLYPTVGWLLSRLPANSEYSWQRIAAYAGLLFVLGALISTLTSEIYKLYEGRVPWPGRLLKWATARQEQRLRKFLRKAESARTAGKSNEYDEAWYQLRLYPLDENNEPYVSRPTLLGNILAGYEQYPYTRYGMDSVFYWPRIWLEMDKDKKEDIDGQWSVADGFTILSAIGFVGGALWILQSLLAGLDLFPYALPTGSPGWAAVVGVGWLVAGYCWYRLSLPFHRQNGEVFKSIFDLYRGKIRRALELRPDEKETWDATWSYLQYLRYVCPKCGTMNLPSTQICAKCGSDTSDAAKMVRTTGKFPLRP
jgi:ribosomal protein L40E